MDHRAIGASPRSPDDDRFNTDDKETKRSICAPTEDNSIVVDMDDEDNTRQPTPEIQVLTRNATQTPVHQNLNKTPHTSYVNALTGNKEANNMAETERKEIEAISDNEDEDMGDEDDPTCARISVPKEETARMRRPWKTTLIIKVLGRKIGYAYLLWQLTAL